VSYSAANRRKDSLENGICIHVQEAERELHLRAGVLRWLNRNAILCIHARRPTISGGAEKNHPCAPSSSPTRAPRTVETAMGHLCYLPDEIIRLPCGRCEHNKLVEAPKSSQRKAVWISGKPQATKPRRGELYAAANPYHLCRMLHDIASLRAQRNINYARQNCPPLHLLRRGGLAQTPNQRGVRKVSLCPKVLPLSWGLVQRNSSMILCQCVCHILEPRFRIFM
jgi:hypothetical protein